MKDTSIEDGKIEVSWTANLMYALTIFTIIPAGMNYNNSSWIEVAILTLIAAAVIYYKGKIKYLYATAGILIVASLIFNFIITKEYIQTKKLNEHYSKYINENENYANTENAKKIKAAIDHYSDENADIAYNALGHKDQNQSQDIDKVINLTNAIKQLTPELKAELKVAMADNFVSIEEYNQLRDKTLKNISLSTLTNEQLVLLGSLK